YCGDIGQTGLKSELEKGKRMLDKLKMPYKVIPGEHDWYLDMGKAWRSMFGDENWSINHNGAHVIGMNSIKIDDFWTGPGLTAEERMGRVLELECNSCGPWGVEADGLEWLEKDVKKVSPDTPIIFFSHSPLWDYYPRWNFATKDAPEIRGILRKFDNVMAVHGHVHQVNSVHEHPVKAVIFYVVEVTICHDSKGERFNLFRCSFRHTAQSNHATCAWCKHACYHRCCSPLRRQAEEISSADFFLFGKNLLIFFFHLILLLSVLFFY
ncbi:metallophosphoesterase family protein, partial [Kaarinaea lacus]